VAVCLTTAIDAWNSRLLAFHEALEFARAPGLAQLAQRLGLDLANTFARGGEHLADLFEGAVGLQADAEAHPEDLLFAWRQRRQDLAHQLGEIAPERRLDRRWREFVLNEVAERALFLVADQAELPEQVAIARWFPMQLKRRGVELRLIVGDHNRSAAIVDLSLVKAVARAHRWFEEISTGKARSLAVITAREGLAVRYVGRLIRMAFLAPEIVESIVEGRQLTTSYRGSTHPAHRASALMVLAENRSER
jgi:hypothetical protein